MKVLIACEYSGTVRDEFIKRGHNAISCDILPTDKLGPHYKCDIRDIINNHWDLMIAHPPCTYLCSSGLHWNKRVPGRNLKTMQALQFVNELLNANIHMICVENPIGRINTAIRKPDQYIQPYQFGHDASKKTGLWLKNLPLLTLDPDNYINPRIVNGKPRWGNQTDSGQNKLGPSGDRWKLRSATYQGWANAMAEQWNF